MQHTAKNAIAAIMLLSVVNFCFGQQKKEFPNSNKFTLAAGLSQPLLLKGYNLAGAYFMNRITLEWSHGWSLNPPLSDEQKEDNMEFEVNWTTGPGVGYRIFPALDVRAEFKAHHYTVMYTEIDLIREYTTYTIGAGAYYRIYPFKKGALRGLLIEPNIRFWPLVGSSVDNNEFSYTDENGITKTHEVITSPFIVNCNIAWTFGR